MRTRQEARTGTMNATAQRLGTMVMTVLLLGAVGCSSNPPAPSSGIKKAASKEQSGFLKDYSRLTRHPKLDESISAFVNDDAVKNLHAYVGVIVDPVDIYVASDADPSRISAPNAERAALYFKSALIGAVQDAFPVVQEPGPLVLRLRSAIVGVDTGGEVAAEAGGQPQKAVNISKAIVELELVDSVSGEVIAAVVDTEAVEGGEVGHVHLSREERFAAARTGMDNWAVRVREFLNAAHERSSEDADRADKALRPYSGY